MDLDRTERIRLFMSSSELHCDRKEISLSLPGESKWSATNDQLENELLVGCFQDEKLVRFFEELARRAFRASRRARI